MKVEGFAVRLAVALVALLAAPALAREDAAHRTDRQRTEALNRSAERAVSARDQANARERARYGAASDAYDRAMAQWRRRTATWRAASAAPAGQ